MLHGDSPNFSSSMSNGDPGQKPTKENMRFSYKLQKVSTNDTSIPDSSGSAKDQLPDPPLMEEQDILHGEAFARDLWLERNGGRIVALFTVVFLLTLIVMMSAGQIPGKSNSIKIVYDLFQVAGDAIAFFLCLRMTFLLHREKQALRQQRRIAISKSIQPADLQHIDEHLSKIRRSYLAWIALSLGVACYLTGQTIWVSYDVRMDSAAIPFPGLYDIFFVGMYPFFLLGTMLLVRHRGETTGQLRLLLDALAIVGAALALSWFFVLQPSISHLYGDLLVKFLTMYLPAADLLLITIGAFVLFNTRTSSALESVFGRLFWGLCFMAFSDSLLSYEILNIDYRTGLLRVILNPLSVLFIALAAIKYPQAIAFAQQRLQAQSSQPSRVLRSYVRQFRSSFHTISPFLLALFTCTILITAVASRGGDILVQATLSAFFLVLVVVVRQALTMIENTRLAQQLQGALTISQQELDVTRKEASVMMREAQEKRVLEDGVDILRNAHAQLARGNFTARATILAGPLMPIAVSFNLMAERLSMFKKQTEAYEHLRAECQVLQTAIEQIANNELLPTIPSLVHQNSTELNHTFLTLSYLQRKFHQQWSTQMQTLESMRRQITQLQESLLEWEKQNDKTTRDRLEYRRLKHSIDQVQQRVDYLFTLFVEQDSRTLS